MKTSILKTTILLILILISFGASAQNEEMNTSEHQIEKKVKEEVTIMENEEVEEIDGEKKIVKKIKMITKDENGKEQIMEWEGSDQDEMPVEMKEKMERMHQSDDIQSEETEIEVDVKKLDENLKSVKIKINQNGERKIIEFESDSDDIEKEIQEKLVEAGVKTNNGEAPDKVILVKKDKASSRTKGSLGVSIADFQGGVLVNGVVGNSAAEKAGLRGGDIIYSIDDIEVKTTKELIQAIGGYYAGDQVKISFSRQDEMMEKVATLKKRVPRTWKEVMKNKN